MNKSLLHIKVQQFIKNYKEDVAALAFSGSPFKEVTVQELLQQIESHKKAEKKLPNWYDTANIYFPPKLNLEQTSSEITAKYKASLISGASLADLTGGFGVDSYYFSERFKTVHHYEQNKSLSAIAAHNFKVFGKKNIKCIDGDGLAAIKNKTYNVIYVDPSRRHEAKGKVFFLNDCEPNIPDALPNLLDNCEVLMLKTSPMLDISVGLKELHAVYEIHIVAVENEVKELIWLLKKGSKNEPIICTVNFRKTKEETFQFTLGAVATSTYSHPLKYLYEPNAAILKSGAFPLISETFGVHKLHKNTHLYTTDTLIEFPGRRFKINAMVPYAKKEIKKALAFKKANVTTRNFPEQVAELKKKWKLSDGGDICLFFTTCTENQKVMLICSKV